MDAHLVPTLMIQDRYELKEKIGSGSFGVVFRCYDHHRKHTLAMKLESLEISTPQLEFECKLYSLLNGVKGIPKIYAYIPRYAFSFGKYNILGMQLLGHNLEEYFQHCGQKFSVKTAFQLGYQMVRILQDVHAKDIIHRDLKPDNFLIDASGNMYLIDFGLAKRYRDPKTHIHIAYRENKSIIGTPRYASINVQLGIESSRRDDLESIGYILAYFLRGSLPWQGLKATTSKRKYQKILETKMASPIDILYKGLPTELMIFAEYVRNLRFADKPDYEYLSKLFTDGLLRLGIPIDGVYDWNIRLPILTGVQEENEDLSVVNHVSVGKPDVTSSHQNSKPKSAIQFEE
jgi:serine/threonine protein kinase